MIYKKLIYPKKISKRNYNDQKYKDWRKKVYLRDNHTCQWPGCKYKGRLNAHHIHKWANYPSLRYDINNGVTLCYKHHKMIAGHEDDYILLFLKILQGKLNHHV
jgi:5-methylcytosine-specific restriction endonuclease McrA